MRKQHLVLLALFAGCTPSTTTTRGLAIDGSHLRVGVRDLGAHTETIDPRLILAQLASWRVQGLSAAHYQPATLPTGPTGPAGEKFATLSWNQGMDGAVTATPGLWIPNYPTQDNLNDRLYTAVQSGSGWKARIYYHLYDAAPQLCAEASLDGAVDNGFIAVSGDGQTFYVPTMNGTLYAIPNVATCTGGSIAPSWTYSAGSAFSRTGAWLDWGTGALFIGATNGTLHAVDANGASLAGFPVNVGGAIHSVPIVWANNVWIGTGAGAMVRVDAASGAIRSSTSLCDGSCGANDAIYATPYFDLDRNVLVTAANGRLIEVDTTCASTDGACSPTTSALRFSNTAGQVWSSPTVDFANGAVYVGFDNQLHKTSYPIYGGSITSTATAGSGPDATYPRSSALLFNGFAFIGDGGGYLDRVTALAGNSIEIPAHTEQMGTSIDTTCVIDYLTGGNVYLGTVGSPGATMPGAMMQIVRAF